MTVERIPLAGPRGIAALGGNPPMPDEEKQCYELVKHNVRHPDPSTTTVVGTVRGPGRALRAVEVLDARLTTEEREAGFRHYTRKSETPVDRKIRRPLGRKPHQR